MAPLILAYGSIALLLMSYLINNLVRARQKLPLPPGPKGLPIVGNVADLPPQGAVEWKHWLPHKDLYGPISSVTVLGQTMVLIHDLKLAVELLDKGSAKYSARPFLVFACEMVGFGNWMGNIQPNNNHRRQRKLAAQQLGSVSAIAKFHSIMKLETGQFLMRMLDRPEALVHNLETQSASLMVKILYGYTPSPHTPDPLLRLITKVMDNINKAFVPGAWLVDLVPWLRYLPDWVPGTGFKQTARKWRQELDDVQQVPMDFVANEMARGSAKPSYVQGLLGQNPEDPEERLRIMHSATALYGGGADTTVGALSFFFMAMALFPEVQIKAREEIDSVIGGGAAAAGVVGLRLPDFGDKENLPYIEAVVKETLRWQVLAPLSLPHGNDEEGEFRGYRIPKGSIILPSIGWFAADPNVYRDPKEFRPERFLGPDAEPSPRAFCFGFGRRVCPGRRLVDASLFLTIAQSLAVLEVGKEVEEATGRVIEPVAATLPGPIAHPVPFRVRVTPRSEKHAELVRRIGVEHPWEEGDAILLKGLSGSVSASDH